MVEGNGLENRRAGNGTVGSNPTLSATLKIDPCGRFLVWQIDRYSNDDALWASAAL